MIKGLMGSDGVFVEGGNMVGEEHAHTESTV
jgi:hypothetical protein